MQYKIVRNVDYDFSGQSYATLYPNLHRYPATMLPQIGIKVLEEFKIQGKYMLDPYCGSGSSFVAGLKLGFQELVGYDLNPLAVLISKAKFTNVNIGILLEHKKQVRNAVFDFIKEEKNIHSITIPEIYNRTYWFSDEVSQYLAVLKHFIQQIEPFDAQQLFWLAFSETVRDCSYARNDEFKLFRMKPEEVLRFNPDVLGVFFTKLNKVLEIYIYTYKPLLNNYYNIAIENKTFQYNKHEYDVVLTSPPYGDSRTTVAYGQFSVLSNEWIGNKNPRKVDACLMGGKQAGDIYTNGVINDYIQLIHAQDTKRALETSAFYFDLESSIKEVAKSVKKHGYAIYVVGNRTVKGIKLPTDQFIAEKFEENGFQHIVTYERLLGNKSMPLRNSPSNIAGNVLATMTAEYIVICQKT